ncbi:FAD-dependent oxidoreductase [Jatrophihabitans sp.]|uniref:FAD-dependent oxidoreductase n=1 Tax=Jatrophihabitans sp. TaxID=1932789 RepID=UPI0030C77F81|nr:FAD-binding protein [Jatrophihabitans sp.]
MSYPSFASPLSALRDPGVAWPVLDAAQIARITAYGTCQDVAEGAYLFHAGQPTTELIVIETGTIDVSRGEIRDLPEWPVVTHGPGRFVGEFSLFTGQTLILSARMTDPGRVHRISLESFRRLMADDPELSDLLLRALLARRKLLRHTAAARAIEIIGTDNSAGSLALRTYASRQMLPHTWLDAAEEEGRAVLAAYGLDAADLPVAVVLDDPIRQATPGMLAERIGLSYRGAAETVDLTVIGGGPAGLAAAVYGASEGLSTVLLDGVGVGGQAATSSRIENYLGFPFGVSGGELTDLGQVQAVKFGARLSSPCQVVSLDSTGPDLRLGISDGTVISTRAVILATGAHYRRLPLARWEDFEGAGIYFAATELEARSCRNDPVTVVGGANSAGQAALFLAASGNPVTIAVRSDPAATMSAYLLDRLRAHPGVTIRTDTEVCALDGATSLETITLRHRRSGEDVEQACHGLFCFIGADPTTAWLDGVALADDGFVRTDADLADADLGPAWSRRRPLPFETSVPRVFAVGDVRFGSMKRIAAAVGEGASAVRSVHAALGADVGTVSP